MTDETKRILYSSLKSDGDVIIIDFMNYVHRFYWTNQELSVNINGETYLTGHIYGMTRFINFLKTHFKNCKIIFALDGRNNRDRREMNSEYKKGRMEHEFLYSPIQDILTICSVYKDVYTCFDDEYEADDIIGSICHCISYLCKKNNIDKRIHILSSDKDMFQLVRDNDKCKIDIIRKFGSGNKWLEDAEVVHEKEVCDKFNGVHPWNLLIYRAITGDSSDNLKGIYRFRKAEAAYIAERTDYDTTDKKFVKKEGVDDYVELRSMSKIYENISQFDSNYQIMRLRDIDFNLDRLSDNCNLDLVYSLVDKYNLSWFRKVVLGIG